MKKLFGFCCLGVVLLGVALGVGLYLGFSSGAQTQEEFFKAVATNEPEKVMALFHPELAKVIDPPILRAWQKAFNKSLGAYKGMKLNGFSTNSKVENGVKTYETKGEIDFEKGTANVELNYLDDKIVQFTVKSPQMGDAWFTGPDGTEFYQAKAKLFLERFLKKEADFAYQMLHEDLQKQVSQTDFNKQTEEIAGVLGAYKSVAFESEKYEETADTQDLRLFFKIDADKPGTGMVKFQFVGLRGLILGYQVKPVD